MCGPRASASAIPKVVMRLKSQHNSKQPPSRWRGLGLAVYARKYSVADSEDSEPEVNDWHCLAGQPRSGQVLAQRRAVSQV
jgi:hypothetical protein